MTRQAPSQRKPRRGRPTQWSLRALQRTRRRELILLTGLVLLACISVLMIVFLILRAQPGVGYVEGQGGAVPAPTHTVTFVQITGLNQAVLAKAAAQNWAEDAQLVSANTRWPKIVNKQQVGEPTAWTYRFYSPAKARLFFVTVSPEGQVETIEHVAPVTLPPPPIAADSWLIDSPTALALWLDNGGDKILGRNPGLEVVIQLRRVNYSPNPVWLVVGLNNQTEEIFAVLIDAYQGVVLPTAPAS